MTGPGTLLDNRYELVEIIGEGGMGVVYEGRHTGLDRRVAVKILHPEWSEVDQAAQRFMQEAQIAGNLGHANICEVTDIGATDEGLPYMVMPLLQGRTLADAIDASVGGMTIPRAIDVVVQILSALQTAHEADIVHRDLKPDNIFLVRMGDREDFVKILDFGISKVVGSKAQDLRRLTATGMVLGTPHYMAPEQAAGAKDLDHRVDLYAVGVLLYELIVGTTPFEGDSYNELIVKIVNEAPPRPQSMNPGISERLERVVLRAMAKSRVHRYASARDFREALLEAGEDAGVSLPLHLGSAGELSRNTLSAAAAEVSRTGPTLSLRTAASRRQRRWLWIAGTLAAIALGVGLVLFGAHRERSQGASPTTPGAAPGAAGDPVAHAGADAGVSKPATPARVSVRFIGLPAGGHIQLDGRQLSGSAISLPSGTTRIPYQAQAPGKLSVSGWLIPNRNQRVPLIFKPLPLPRPRPMPMPMTTPVPVPPKPAVMIAPVNPMRWTTIRGRGGTSVKTDYDAQD